MNEIEELKDTIEMLKQEIKAMQEQQENNYRLLNERLDYLSTTMFNPPAPNKSE